MNQQTQMIELARLHPSKTQPRKHFDEEREKELVASMKQHGFTLSVLLVRPLHENGDYEIVAGERRVRAARVAGIEEAPCYVRLYSDGEVIAIQLLENLQRVDLTPIEQADGFRQALELRDNEGKPMFTLESLAEQIGKSVSTVRRRLSLCNLPEEARREVEAGRLEPIVAHLITRLPEEKLRMEATRVILHPKLEKGPLSFRAAELEIHRRFMRDLRQAKFARDDDKLVPIYHDAQGERAGGGACNDCPFRTESEGRGKITFCLNPSCFKQKEEKEWQLWQAANTDAATNRVATTEEQSCKLYPSGNQLAQHFGMVDLKERPDGTDLRPGITCNDTWEELTKKSGLKVIVTRDRQGGVHELVDRQQAVQASRAKLGKEFAKIFKTAEEGDRCPKCGSLNFTKSANGGKHCNDCQQEFDRKEARKRDEADSEKQRQRNRAVLLECLMLAQPKVNNETIAGMIRLQMDREIEYSQAHADFLKRHKLPIGGSIGRHLSSWKLKDLIILLLEFILSEGGFSYDSALEPADRAWLKIFGVDYEKVGKQYDKKRAA